MTNPDPIGVNGEGAAKDGPVIADAAVQWLQHKRRSETPFCITVSFVNPHEKQFFWAGSEGTFYELLFVGQPVRPFATGYTSVPGEENPDRFRIQ